MVKVQTAERTWGLWPYMTGLQKAQGDTENRTLGRGPFVLTAA